MIKKTCSTLKMGLWNVGGLISKQINKTTDPEFRLIDCLHKIARPPKYRLLAWSANEITVVGPNF
jgi:hypothetical protein